MNLLLTWAHFNLLLLEHHKHKTQYSRNHIHKQNDVRYVEMKKEQDHEMIVEKLYIQNNSKLSEVYLFAGAANYVSGK